MFRRPAESLLRQFGAWLYRAGFARFIYALAPCTPRVVLYHACESTPSDYTEGIGSSISPATLRVHFEFFKRHYNLVAPEALQGSLELPARPLVVTFDDGYRSVHDHAYPLLAEAGIPAIVYLITGVIGGGLVWVNELNWWLRRYPGLARPRVAAAFDLPLDAAPQVMLEVARGRFDASRVAELLKGIRGAASLEALEEVHAEPLYLDWPQIEVMRRNGIRFGCHTASHPTLPSLAPDAQRREIGEAREEIVRHLGSCASFAFPFGDVDPQSRAAAIAAGFESLMEVGGFNWPWDVTRIARVPVTAATAPELFAELEIVAPIKSLLRWLMGLRPLRTPPQRELSNRRD
jgi:peptidoglycan/xylan/chitin deacetylase (PgdA/CDA1 family)